MLCSRIEWGGLGTIGDLSIFITRGAKNKINYITISISNEIGHFSGSSDGPDPSSSDFSADTVIYLGPSDDATDGEHPPVYIPSMNSGDNRCSMSKILKGSTAERPSKLPQKKPLKRNYQFAYYLYFFSWKFSCFSFSSTPIPCGKVFIFLHAIIRFFH